MFDAPVSIGLIAIGRNEGDRLKRCLRSVPATVSVIYVDSASTDDSVAFARLVNATVVELDMSRPFSAARARNEGFDALRQIKPGLEYVQFIDGDCELEPAWLSQAGGFLANNTGVAAVCGRRRERYPEASFYNRMCDEEWNTPIGQTDACGGDALMRISAFKEVGGYDPVMIAGEEPELCQRLRFRGWQIWRLDAPMTIHDADMHRFGQYWNRAIRSGFGYAQVNHKTKASGSDELYKREVASALVWTIGLALAAILLTALFGVAGLVLTSAIWLMQLLRLALRFGLAKAFHLLVGKIAETVGIVRFFISKARGHKQGAIFYK